MMQHQSGRERILQSLTSAWKRFCAVLPYVMPRAMPYAITRPMSCHAIPSSMHAMLYLVPSHALPISMQITLMNLSLC